MFMTQIMVFSSCSQGDSFGPGYSWDLFKNTPSSDLAKAVETEDTSEIYAIINKGNVDINFQEPKFGRTLLMLAVGNDKEISTNALLKMGADVNLRDKRDDQAIHEAVAYINLKSHSYNILNQLLIYNADVNSVSKKSTNVVPLAGAVQNLACTKLLLDYKADPYFKIDSTYSVWFNLLVLDNATNENIITAEYMIVDRKLLIPNPIFYTGPTQIKPRDIFSLLEQVDVSDDSKKQKAKENIINYLHQIDFPNSQTYH